jgi:hypothetical protein
MFIPDSTNPHPVFDKIPTENHPPPWSRDRVARFQKQINQIAGLSINGKPNVRLMWPADPDESISMKIVNGEKRAKYRLFTEVYECTRKDATSGLDIVEFVNVDVCLNRWVIEEYHAPEEEEFNPGPEGRTGRGYYTHLYTVAHHTEKCCNGTEAKNGRLCFGLYHEPNYRTLEELQRRIRLRDAASHGHRPGDHVSDGEWAEEMRNLKDWKEGWGEHLRGKYQEAIMDALNTHGWRLYDHDAGKRSKYHFVNQGES